MRDPGTEHFHKNILMGFLSWLLRKPAPPSQQLHFVMYSRQSCHLCDLAWELLKEAQARHGFTLTKIDVDSDPELNARFGLEVPVVIVNGKVRFRGEVNRVLLERLLKRC